MAVTLPSGLRHRTHAAMVRSSPRSHEAARRRAGTSRPSIAIRARYLISLKRLRTIGADPSREANGVSSWFPPASRPAAHTMTNSDRAFSAFAVSICR